MYIDSLIINTKNGNLRNIQFHNGLNLIVDNTPKSKIIQTGNNVGKTTVLKLIDFLFGADKNIIYKDTENKKEEYKIISDFLVQEEVSVILKMRGDFNSSSTIELERNFLQRNKAVYKINGNETTKEEYENEIRKLLFPSLKEVKPTLRQLLSHNIRYRINPLSNTLKTLDSYTKDTEYETLYLYLLGFDVVNGEEKQKLLEKIKQEENFKKRIENGNTLNGYKLGLEQINQQIASLNEQKETLSLSEEFNSILEDFNKIKYQITLVSDEIVQLNLKNSMIEDSKVKLEDKYANIDKSKVEELYKSVKLNFPNITKSFNQLIDFHNSMIKEHINFITSDQPSLLNSITVKKEELKKLQEKEEGYSKKIYTYNSFGTLDEIISKLNEAYNHKGEFESIIKRLTEIETELSTYNSQLNKIENIYFSSSFKEKLNEKINAFNNLFSYVSNELYGESYYISYDISQVKGHKVYKFKSFNSNLSTGKKQGEILCFDIAYILYARKEKLPVMNFIINDQKELLHGNQLVKVDSFVKENNIQLIIPILKDKLPEELVTDANIVLQLSQSDKLFKINS